VSWGFTVKLDFMYFDETVGESALQSLKSKIECMIQTSKEENNND